MAASHGIEDDSDDDQEVSDLPLPAWMEGDSLAPPCQADRQVVKAIIDFAGVTADDVLYDLGCGDGRICVEAAESRGARACGVEIEEDLAIKFRRRVAAKGLESKVRVIHGDLREVDLSDATVVITYLLPQAMKDLAKSHLLPLLRRGLNGRSNIEAEELETRNKTVEDVAGKPESTDANESVIRNVVQTSARRDIPWSDGASSSANSEHLSGGRCPQSELIADCNASGAPLDARWGSNTAERSSGRPCRIVCNTWGIPGAVPVKEAGVGMYGGVKLRLFTSESLS